MAEKKDWQGRVGAEWANRVDGLDAMLAELGQAGIAKLDIVQGLRVLDVGCGAGSSSRILSSQGAIVTGVDISQDLIDVANTRGTEKYLLADAGIDDLGGPFDVVFSRFGAMFFDDPIVAWSHIRNETVTGAKLAIVCWAQPDENGWATIPLMAASKLLGAENANIARSTSPGPFAWGDTDHFKDILTRSGWENVQWSALEQHVAIKTVGIDNPVESAIEFLLRIGPLASRLTGKSPEFREKVAMSLSAALKQYIRDDTVYLPAKAWVITAHN